MDAAADNNHRCSQAKCVEVDIIAHDALNLPIVSQKLSCAADRIDAFDGEEQSRKQQHLPRHHLRGQASVSRTRSPAAIHRPKVTWGNLSYPKAKRDKQQEMICLHSQIDEQYAKRKTCMVKAKLDLILC